MLRYVGRLAVILLMLMCASPNAGAQRMALKTNVLEYAVLTPNLAFETRLNRYLSMQLSMSVNPVTHPIGGYSAAHFRVEPELRYWFNRPMARHFVALSFTGGAYNIKLKDHYIDGDVFAAGVSYGYALVLKKHWNVEFEAGVGLGSFKAYDYRREESRPKQKNYSRVLPVPIRLGVSFGYIF